MKKFVLNICKIMIIILLFNGVVYWFAQKHYFQEYEVVPSKSFSSFIFADSHGLGISNFSEDFQVYNFSAASDSYFDIKRKIIFLLENEYSLDTIYLSVDDHTLSPYRDLINNKDRSTFYTSKNDLDSHFNFFKEKYVKNYVPILQPKIRALLKSYLETQIKNSFHLDADATEELLWYELPEEEKIKMSESRMKSQFTSETGSEKLKNELIDIIQLCQIHNIELIGVKFPLSKVYLETIGTQNYHADQVFETHQLKVFDGKEMFIENETYFMNQDHLNALGGQIFTQKWFEKKLKNKHLSPSPQIKNSLFDNRK